jgi:prevent-host-death family protein
MRSIGAYDAKTHLPRLLEEVRRGERITITRHGVAVAVLSPPDSEQALEAREAAVASLRDFARGRTLAGSVREMRDEGRR